MFALHGILFIIAGLGLLGHLQTPNPPLKPTSQEVLKHPHEIIEAYKALYKQYEEQRAKQGMVTKYVCSTYYLPGDEEGLRHLLKYDDDKAHYPFLIDGSLLNIHHSGQLRFVLHFLDIEIRAIRIDLLDQKGQVLAAFDGEKQEDIDEMKYNTGMLAALADKPGFERALRLHNVEFFFACGTNMQQLRIFELLEKNPSPRKTGQLPVIVIGHEDAKRVTAVRLRGENQQTIQIANIFARPDWDDAMIREYREAHATTQPVVHGNAATTQPSSEMTMEEVFGPRKKPTQDSK